MRYNTLSIGSAEEAASELKATGNATTMELTAALCNALDRIATLEKKTAAVTVLLMTNKSE